MPSQTATIGTPVGQLDVETVVNASQALSSEIVLPKLIEKLMRIAVEHAGAERGLLILLRGDQPQIEAEAIAGHGSVEVTVRQATATPSDLPHSVLNYAIRTRERVVLHDASVANLYSEDEYVLRKRPKSVLCLPIVKQTKPVGALYLENYLTPSVFTADRVAVLALLASQAAISLENAGLYSDLRQSESELRQLLDLTPQHITEFGPDGSRLYNNRAALDYHGLTLQEWQTGDLRALVHPQDAERLSREQPSRFSKGVPYEIEARLRRKDGQYRWFLARFNPILDEQGRLTRWYAAATDIDDRKQAEQRLHDENLALREQIDEAFMFEEIVGSSAALKTVLASIVKVAPTDSTVLITGETGTGKELIARAIHKRSRRSGHAFIGVNCASIPAPLIASELFGHEKGAFTGALQQRRGRFELAHSGTIFLDEIGDLPAETQIVLLRVLQEREIERVGSSRAIAVDVRVLAATNRDLEAAVKSGAFRQDLYYRLNVFPIRNPPLRERVEDIPVLVEYLVERYAKKAGKSIRKIKKQTLELFQAYDWPGNVRELQNVIERAVVLCEGDTFVIDSSWLEGKRNSASSRAGRKVTTLSEGERALIEAALAETNGRISGPSGAAAKLGIPRQTLESKMRALNIDRRPFRVR